ncbi:bile acid:sodium symporter family protein [Desulfocurvibacter africanus]|uniref:Bile acid:sodium symporter n=1 Tax=Desulfocurvibacter africanus subsp. africanus str. Walvis Bay TaxID=690850 RepID=F3YZU8_DESAF|nr:bile acid:sodium symporter [Desulfocurvibacter africanus]EGJ50903.1 Bile acid:sodium symporter [Desulfocurvibacter africanus subsp. africanus str. Walvis Bay]
MFLLDTFQKVLFLLFLVLSMLSIGLVTGMRDLRAVFAARGLLARALLVNFIVVPALGTAIVLLLPLDPPAAAALLILACTPGGPSALQFTKQAEGTTALAGVLTFLLTLLAVFVSDWLLRLVLPAAIQPVVPRWEAMIYLKVYFLLPLVAGMLLFAWQPGLAARLARPMALAGAVSFIAFMVYTGGARREAMADIEGMALGAMLVFFLLSLAAGWVLGGPARESRQVMATAASMRNVALCLAMANASPQGHAVLVPLVAFSLLMVPPNMLFTVYGALQARRENRKPA